MNKILFELISICVKFQIQLYAINAIM